MDRLSERERHVGATGRGVAEHFGLTPRDIDVRDQPTLTRAGISLDDRGFDLASGRQLYGNWAGVPYAMTRVGETLRWTLGPVHRSAEQYEARMAALGGPTAPAPFLPAAGASGGAGAPAAEEQRVGHAQLHAVKFAALERVARAEQQRRDTPGLPPGVGVIE